MSTGSVSDQGIGRISFGISQGELPRRTIQFVYDCLPAWRDDADRPNEQSEKKLNLQLCKFLDSKARNDFPMVRFDHEEYQSGRRTVDLSASPSEAMTIDAKFHTKYDPFLVLEGKRLPAPVKGREMEYVTGFGRISGGIQRFKLGLHGKAYEIVAIIGYIQKETPKFWYAEVRKWILELASGDVEDQCSWDRSEILRLFKSDDSGSISRCMSDHPRTGYGSTKRIDIHHLWVEMSPNTGTVSEAQSG